MAKIKLCADPTFKAPVPIPVPGAKPSSVEFTFKHRTKKEVADWGNSLNKKTDLSMLKEIVLGWELDDEFNDENITKLCENYAGAAYAIFETYLEELRGARVKN